MKKLTLTGAFVRQAAIAFSQKDGAKTVRVNFTSAWTEKIRTALGWNELLAEQHSVDLDGELQVSAACLNTGSNEWDFFSGIISNFRAVRVDDGKKSSIQLRWQYKCHMSGIAANVESYGETSSRAKGKFVISYEYIAPETGSEEDQTEMDLEEAEE